jgi:hypothetical protein
VVRLLELLEECEGWLDPEYADDGLNSTLPVAVVDAMSKIYVELER